MYVWLLVAAPLALIFVVGAAVWLEGHILDQPADGVGSTGTSSETLPTVSSTS
jgi:hypothetical protein